MLLYCHTFDRREIRIITANDAFAQRLPKLFRRAFSLSFDHVPPEGAAGKRTFLITAPEKILSILEVFGQESAVSHHINYGVLETDCCRQSFFNVHRRHAPLALTLCSDVSRHTVDECSRPGRIQCIRS